MEKTLTNFFQIYPLKGDVKLALKMVKEKIECSIKALKEPKEKESDEYMKYLSEAHRMIETIFSEMGKHPDSYR